MLATLNVLTNPFNPTLDRIQKPITRKVRINTLVKKHKIDLTKPVICYHNGEVILRKEWKRTVSNNDIVTFIYLPQGGGGSNPLKLVMMIALTVYSGGIAAAIAPGLEAGSIGLQLLSAGVSMLGNVLINALIPPPQPPKAQQANQAAQASPTYTISAQGNQGRIGQAIPVIYGKMKVYPDFAAQPYAEFENNEQYLYELFCVSQGKVDIPLDQVFIEDNVISSYGSDYQVEIIPPGANPTLFPNEVFNTSAVSGQELFAGSPIGPFVVSPVDPTGNKKTDTNQLAFDIILTRGLGYVNDTGGIDARTVQVSFYATQLNDAGVPIGPQFLLGSPTISGATATPIRKTFKFPVTSGRYQVTATRLDTKDLDTRTSNDVVWASARGYSSYVSHAYGDVTLLAVKVKATNSVSSQSSRKINVIATRQLEIPTFNAGTGAYNWSSRTSTRSIAWAIADMCRAAYGAGMTEARFDVAQLLALDAIWTSRGDTLNCVFDSSQTFWDALTMACRAGRCRPYVQGGIIHFVRDALQTLPTAMFSNRNIVKNTFKITYIMPSADNADCIDVEYFDETIWKPRVVRAALDVGTTTKPAKVKAFGITNRAQAYREGMYMAGSNRYRRKEISFETELEGHIPSLGDLIGVQSDIPDWGQSGEVQGVTSTSATTSAITSSEPFTWTNGAIHYAMLRRADGTAAGPIVVTRGSADNILNYNNADVDFQIYSGFQKEKTHIVFGKTGQLIQLARVLSTTPRDKTVQISCINEDTTVHAVDGTSIPIDNYQWALVTPKSKPILTDFTITQTGNGVTPSMSISWAAAQGATKYIIESSTDGQNWTTLGEVTTTSFSFLANTGSLNIRVAAFGAVLGPYITKNIQIGAVAPPADVASGSVSANGQAYNATWATVADCDGYYVEILNAGSVKRSFNTVTTNYDYTLENAIADGGPWRAITIKVKATKGSVRSVNALVLNGTNAAPAAPTVTVVPGAGNLGITVSKCADTDYAGTVIHASTTSGFTPSPANKVFDGTGNFFLEFTTATMYIVAAHYDTYGAIALNYSAETNGTPLASLGNKVSEAYLYQWATTMPAGNFPNGNSTFTWTTGAHTAYTGTNGWQTTIPANPGTSGLSLWRASKQVVDTSTATTTTLDWTGGYTVSALSTNGAQGPTGPAGATVVGPAGTTGNSYRVAYAVSSLASLSATPSTTSTSGLSSFPADNTWGGSEVWGGSTTTLTAGQYLHKIDGVYSPSTGNTVWSAPYQAALKVGNLSAISADLGSITAGSIAIDNAGFIRGGQTGWMQNTGFFLGYSGTTYKFSLGNSLNYLNWDGTNLNINSPQLSLNSSGIDINTPNLTVNSTTGNAYFSGNLNAASGTFNGTLLAGVLDLSSAIGETHVYTPANNGATITSPVGKTSVRITVRGGGGGGAGGGNSGGIVGGGGGGAGGGSGNVVFTQSNITAGTTYTINVGNGGAGGGPNGGGGAGQPSYVTSGGVTLVISNGGGGGSPGAIGNSGNGGPGGAGGAGGAAGSNGTVGGNGYTGNSGTLGFPPAVNGGEGGPGGAGGSLNGGAGGTGGYAGTGGNLASSGSSGGPGQVVVEFYNPNSVVLMDQYAVLKQRLTAQFGYVPGGGD